MTFHQAPATHINHAKFRVADLALMKDFYGKKLGFQVSDVNDTTAVVSADGRTPLLTLETSDSYQKSSEPKTGLFHVAFLLPDRSALGGFLRHIAALNYPVQGASDHGVSEAIYLADPEGNGLEFYRDRDPSAWNWNGSQINMVTEPLNAEGLLHEAAAWKAMPEAVIIGHIHLKVTDTAKAEEFYTQVLQFNTVSMLGRQALFLSTRNYHHHMGLNTWAGTNLPPLAENETGLAYYSIAYPTPEAREKAAEALSSQGYEVRKENDTYFVEDPFGIHVQLA